MTGLYAPLIGPLREGESRYRDLPVLYRCTHCGAPLKPLDQWAVGGRAGYAHTGVCHPCSRALSR